MNEKMISYCALTSGENPTWNVDGPEIAVADPETQPERPVATSDELERLVREHAEKRSVP
jgi:hypothetical protein